VRLCVCASVRLVCASVRLCVCASVRLCVCASVRLCVCACDVLASNVYPSSGSIALAQSPAHYSLESPTPMVPACSSVLSLLSFPILWVHLHSKRTRQILVFAVELKSDRRPWWHGKTLRSGSFGLS
jgi:hypothetical protein